VDQPVIQNLSRSLMIFNNLLMQNVNIFKGAEHLDTM